MRWVNLHNWSKLILQIHIGSNGGRAICAAEHSDSEGEVRVSYGREWHKPFVMHSTDDAHGANVRSCQMMK